MLLRRLALRERMQPLGSGVVELQQWRLLDRDGAPIPLTGTEMDLVAGLVSHVGQILARETLLRLAPARDGEAFDRSIDSRLARLRRKLEAHAIVLRIRPARGIGYRLEDQAPAKIQLEGSQLLRIIDRSCGGRAAIHAVPLARQTMADPSATSVPQP
ncbi:hypothetical protein BKE38_11150 [Pseudoroseomonas deserti]|uniref:OmpR/PhoB-type domain-containing protein n=1 Tax=Teichococcus deserti TaxID=1817963 RepID=A0A1V2H407_9PROT|nr:winged helix-turn-helix domain-containing protein [Pseudoroseomonas deserti]ONG54024.1 hypothetical protein BKE38_11150 [Pseudoroseomonas deserti]